MKERIEKLEKQNKILESIISQSIVDNRDNKNVIIDYIDLSLQPFLEYIVARKKQTENK